LSHREKGDRLGRSIGRESVTVESTIPSNYRIKGVPKEERRKKKKRRAKRGERNLSSEKKKSHPLNVLAQ